jgi:hypothetical protein
VTEKVEGEEIFSLNREAYKEKGPVAFPPRKEWYNWARKEDDKEGIANDETIMSEKYRQSRIDTNARNKWSAEMATYVLKKLSKNDQIRIRDARLDMALMYEIGDMFVVEDGIVNTLLIRIEDGRNAWELTKEDIESALKDMKLKDLY